MFLRRVVPFITILVLACGDLAIGRQEGPGEFVPRENRRPFRPIVDATFLNAGDVTDQVHDNELVLGVVMDDAARAYPINMLTGPRREIINDTLAGRSIAATW